MRIALLSGADKNAGDFLIVHRAKALMQSCHPGCEIVEFRRNESLEPHLDDLNACDIAVFAGGPGYVRDSYPGRFPLVTDLSRIHPPLFALGMGGYSPMPAVSSYQCTEKSRELLNRIRDDGFAFGCRDVLGEQILHNWGYENTVLTGCPAWYDIALAETDTFAEGQPTSSIERIAISDPSSVYNMHYAPLLVGFLHDRFPYACITFVFHRGWTADEFTNPSQAKRAEELRLWLSEHDIECLDISYGHEGFKIYNECDLQIGFRVHAHLYTLSQRRPSILIEEDGRGFGANKTLGLPHIGLYPTSSFELYGKKALNKLAGKPPSLSTFETERFQNAVAMRLEQCLESNFTDVATAFETMVAHYPVMREHIRSMANANKGA